LEVVFDACEQHLASNEKVALHAMAAIVECAGHMPKTLSKAVFIRRFDSLYHRAIERLDAQAHLSLTQRFQQGHAVLDGSITKRDAREHYPWFIGNA